MAATAEFAPEVFEGERYCGSLYAERQWFGMLALKAAGVEVEQSRLDAVIENAFDDHMTALTENIVTDEEYAEELVFGTPKVRKIVDGKVVSKTGRPIYDVIETGVKYSRVLAENDEVFQHQADRDEGDRLFMEVVDSLETREAAHVVSMDPKSWYETHPDLCDSIGYREGMAIQHVAYRSAEDTMLMWTYAIKQSNPQAIARIYCEDYGVDIPEDTSPDFWIRHVHRAKMPKEWVEQIGGRTLERHTRLTESKVRHYSVDEFMAENVETIREVFDAYMPRIVTSISTKENDPELQLLALTINNAAGENLKPEVRRQLLAIANRTSFDEDNGRLMKVMLRYATLEKLRTKIPAYKKRIDNLTYSSGSMILHQANIVYTFNPSAVAAEAHQMHQLRSTMAQNIAAGVAAGRSVGGCSGISLTSTHKLNENPFNNMFSRVDAELNLQAPEQSEKGEDDDEYGPLVFECTEGHTNRRPRGKLIDKCQTKNCPGSVGCA